MLLIQANEDGKVFNPVPIFGYDGGAYALIRINAWKLSIPMKWFCLLMLTATFLAFLACTQQLTGSAPTTSPVPLTTIAPSVSSPTPAPSMPAIASMPKPMLQVSESGLAYVVVDTGQGKCYNNELETTCPQPGEPLFGQDAQYAGIQPRYLDNGDGTVTDLNAGLMWQKDPRDKKTYADAVKGTGLLDLGG
jgi:hypothetical protein